jgi:hypothetical protein
VTVAGYHILASLSAATLNSRNGHRALYLKSADRIGVPGINEPDSLAIWKLALVARPQRIGRA